MLNDKHFLDIFNIDDFLFYVNYDLKDFDSYQKVIWLKHKKDKDIVLTLRFPYQRTDSFIHVSMSTDKFDITESQLNELKKNILDIIHVLEKAFDPIKKDTQPDENLIVLSEKNDKPFFDFYFSYNRKISFKESGVNLYSNCLYFIYFLTEYHLIMDKKDLDFISRLSNNQFLINPNQLLGFTKTEDRDSNIVELFNDVIKTNNGMLTKDSKELLSLNLKT